MTEDLAATVERLQAELRLAQARESAALADAAELRAALAASEAREAAMAEVLRVIAASPTDAHPVLTAVTENTRTLSDSACVILTLREGDRYRVVAKDGSFPGAAEMGDVGYVSQRRGLSQAIRELRAGHIRDTSDPTARAEYPDSPAHDSMTRLNVPLVHNGVAIGGLSINRDHVRAYTDREIALVESFASQAAIAIANARLFEELERRNAELQTSNRQVSESLDQQTALAEVLRVIASSPTNLQDVLNRLVESAARLCSAPSAVLQQIRDEDQHLFGVAMYGRLRVGRWG